MPSPRANLRRFDLIASAGVGMLGAAAPNMPTPATARYPSSMRFSAGEGMAPGFGISRQLNQLLACKNWQSKSCGRKMGIPELGIHPIAFVSLWVHQFIFICGWD